MDDLEMRHALTQIYAVVYAILKGSMQKVDVGTANLITQVPYFFLRVHGYHLKLVVTASPMK